MRITLIVLASLVQSGAAAAQPVSFGFVGGTSLTRSFPISRSLYRDVDFPGGLTSFDLYSDKRSILAGFSFELDLTRRLSLEADALHRPLYLERRFIFPDGSRQDAGRDSNGTWQWPILLKYRIAALGGVRPFVEAGPSFRTRHNPAPTEPSQFGATAGAGVEFRAGRLRLSPALRYTRWQYDGDYPRIATKRDQIEFLTGLSYATAPSQWKLGARKLRFGFLAGTPLTGGLPRIPWETAPEKQGYLGGLALEFELNRRWSIELDGIYRPVRVGRAFATDGMTVLTWQFPALANYRLREGRRVRPVIEAGPSFRLSGNRNAYYPSSLGFTAGIGFETDYKALRFGPVLRYTRWAADSPPYRWQLRTRPNQLELVVPFTF